MHKEYYKIKTKTIVFYIKNFNFFFGPMKRSLQTKCYGVLKSEKLTQDDIYNIYPKVKYIIEKKGGRFVLEFENEEDLEESSNIENNIDKNIQITYAKKNKKEKKDQVKNVICISHLTKETKEENIKSIFKDFGGVKYVTIKSKEIKGGFCFIKLKNEEDCKKLKETSLEYQFNGKKLQISEPKEDKQIQGVNISKKDCLFIYGFDKSVSKDQIIQIFSNFKIKDIVIPTSAKYYALVELSNPKLTKKAIEKLDGFKLNGTKINLCPFNKEI